MEQAATQRPDLQPIKARKIGRQELIGAACIGALFMTGVLVLGSQAVKATGDWWKQDSLSDRMAQLAVDGKPEAIDWMILHGSSPDRELLVPSLKAAADEGHAQSMYLYGAWLSQHKDMTGARAYLSRAAEAGYPDALLVAERFK